MTNRTDDFNRSNGAIGSPSVGSAWNQLAGSWGIFANRANLNDGSSPGVCTLESSTADVDVQVTIGANGYSSGSALGLVARVVDANNHLTFNCDFDNGIRIFKRVSGTYNLINSVAHTWSSSGSVVKFSVSGSTLTAYVDGVQKLQVTDSTFSTATQHGLWAYGDSVSSFDNFSITDIVATPTTHTTTGALAASAATVSGTAAHAVPAGTHPASGALAASAATISGTAAKTSAATGTITTVALKNNTGTLLASTVVDKLVALRLSDMSVAATWTSQTTNSSGILTLTGVVAAIDYLLVTSNTAGSAVGVRKYTAA